MLEGHNISQSSKWTVNVLLSSLSTVSVVLIIVCLGLNPLCAVDFQIGPGVELGQTEEIELQPMIFEHVPLMPGLKVIDRLDGSPHEVAVYKAVTEAAGTVVADDIFDYYEYNLPKQGWDVVPGHRGYFVNSSEELRITQHTRQDVLTVTFKLHK